MHQLRANSRAKSKKNKEKFNESTEGTYEMTDSRQGFQTNNPRLSKSTKQQRTKKSKASSNIDKSDEKFAGFDFSDS